MEKGKGTQVELSGLPELRGRNRERSGKLELAGLLKRKELHETRALDHMVTLVLV